MLKTKLKILLCRTLAALTLGGRAQTRQRTISVAEFKDRMQGAWLGKSAGVSFGWPTEFRYNGRLVPEDKMPTWKPELINETFSQDDLYVQMTFISTLLRRGLDVTTRAAGIDFANSTYRLWCANHHARNNLRNGIAAPASSHPDCHPTTDDLDYQIESDFTGILSPGIVQASVDLGERFGRIMNYGDGLYAGQFVGAMYAEAYFESDREKIVEKALSVIPPECRYAAMVRDVLSWYRTDRRDWKGTWRKIVDRYSSEPYVGKVTKPRLDVKLNGAMVLLGLLYGDGDIDRTMYIATAAGYDSDCNPSTACGILGVRLGYEKLKGKYASRLDREKTWEFTEYNWDGLIDACERLARQLIVRYGGRIEMDASGGERFVLPQTPVRRSAFFDSMRPDAAPSDRRLTPGERAQIRYLPCARQGDQSVQKLPDGPLSGGVTERILLSTGWRFARNDATGETPPGIDKLSLVLDQANGGDAETEVPAFAYARAEFDDSAWTTVSVPHDWAIDNPFSPTNAYGDAFLCVSGSGWYRRKLAMRRGRIEDADGGLDVPPSAKVCFESDGAMSYAMVWVNGHFVGGWPYGYTPFRCDLTKHLKEGDNVLAVRCYNPPESSRWYTGSGLYRRCRLAVYSGDYVVPDSLAITTPQVSKESATVAVRYRRAKSGTTNFTWTVRNPRLWDVDSPELYELDVDGQKVRYGIRSIAFFADRRGFVLNGRTVPLNGVSLHHDLGAFGAAWNRTAMKRRLLKLKEAGANAIRSAHNQPDPGLLDLCDELGLLVKDEVFDDWRHIGMAGKRKNGYSRLFDRWHERDLRAWMRADRNHPSVIMWSLGNEIADGFPSIAPTAEFTATAGELNRLAHEEDDTRPTANANNCSVNFTNDFARTLDVFGFNYQCYCLSAFVKAHPDIPFFFSESQCMSSTRGVFTFPLVKHWAQDGFRDFHNSSYCYEAAGWKRPDEGWACPPDVQWHWMDRHPACMGEFVWTGIDYLGGPFWCDVLRKKPKFTDPVRQAKALEEVARHGLVDGGIHSCNTGFLDLAAYPKEAFWLYQSRWRPDLPMAHIVPHWNWPERVGEKVPVHVFTSGDEGELFLNGRSLGRRRKDPNAWDKAYRLAWDDVVYEPGRLDVVVRRDGKEWARDTVITVGEAARLALEQEPWPFDAAGDLAFVNLTVVDKNGRMVPRAAPCVTFEVSGPGAFVATDNGDEADFTAFASPTKRAFNGRLQLIVRKGETSKVPVVVSARASGLPIATLRLKPSRDVGCSALNGVGMTVEPISARIFGQNIEHTRAGVVHGLSAECVKNRKFAGRPSPEGVAWGWNAFGTKAVYDMLSAQGFTHHAPKTHIPRFHEINSQKVTSLQERGCAGISQTMSLRAVGYRFVAHVRGCFERETVPWRVRFVTSNGVELARRRFAVTGTGWREMTFDFVSEQATSARLEIGVEGVASGVVGAVSVLPSDHFHGMRRDVVECLKEIGTSVIRWPGGCFAGDYRWRDGLLPRDERAPLQSFMPSTQVYTESFDDNDIGTDEILALCAELGAEPFFTLNPKWDKPEDSADWLRHCRGRVKRWSIGNELYSPAMEGTVGPDGYVRLARAHADAMLKVDPTVTLAGLGAYESRDLRAAWAEDAARPLADILPLASVHQYVNPEVLDYSSPERIAETVTRTLGAADDVCDELRRVRALLPANVRMSHDEWNIWCVWYRQDAPVNGVCILHYLHRLMRDQTALKLDNACYFQATEGAVRFTPQTAWLSSVGEAFRLAKAHVGGCPLAGLSQEVFATEHADGRGVVTFYNQSAFDSRIFRLPWKNGRLVRAELVSFASPLPGTRGVRSEAACGETNGWSTITLPPLALAKVTVLRESAGD